MRSTRKFVLEDQALRFLTGLNEKISIVKTHVLLMDSLRSINKIYSLIAQEESNMIATFVVDDSILFANAYDAKKAYGRGRGSFGKNNSRYCTLQ